MPAVDPDEHDVPVRLYTFAREQRRTWAFRIGAVEGYGALPDEAIRQAVDALNLDDLAALRAQADARHAAG